jgi:penicillin-binding protein 2
MLLVLAVLLIRIWYLQIYMGDYYLQLSENNRVRRIEIPAPRGMLYDRFGKIMLGNRPFYDLVLIPQYVRGEEKTLRVVSNLLHIPFAELQQEMRRVRGQPKFLPVILKRNLSLHEVAIIEGQKTFLPGIDISIAPRRDYHEDSPPHILGYIGEISAESMKSLNQKDPNNPYLMGELVGKHGLELQWENLLRGKRGYKYIQVDALGRQTRFTDDMGWKFPINPAIPGVDLTLTIDMDLQQAATQAFQGKQGSVIVMNPKNGEIYALVSAPDFNPSMYQEGISIDKWQALVNDPFKPLFDKTSGGTFPPGSAYKLVVAIAALEEGIIKPGSTYFCPGVFTLGNQPFHCHKRQGHGTVNLVEALSGSCDVYFYHLGIELGMDRIAKYAKAFGLGQKLGLRLNREESGLIPTNDWWRKRFGFPPNKGDIPSLAIGQGANLVTPLQLASLYASIANGGKVWKPYIVKRASSSVGETLFEQTPELLREVSHVKPETLQLMREFLLQVVDHGTGRRAQVPGVTVAGKTSTAQVVSLKKTSNKKATRMQWREHAMFTAFSPVTDAEIVVAIVSENDISDRGGGYSAAPVAQQILQVYWNKKWGKPLYAKPLALTPDPKKIEVIKKDTSETGR